MKASSVVLFVVVATLVSCFAWVSMTRRALSEKFSEEQSKWGKDRISLTSSVAEEKEKVRVLNDRLHALAFEAGGADRTLQVTTSKLSAEQRQLAAELDAERFRAASAAAVAEKTIQEGQTVRESAYAEGWNAAVAAINAKISAAQAEGSRPGAIYIQTGSAPQPPAESR